MSQSNFFFYRRYINGLSAEDNLNNNFPLVGDSPFGDGRIEIEQDGDFRCKVTNKEGNKEDFLRLIYPLLTQEGIERAIHFEAKDLDELSLEQYQSKKAVVNTSVYKTEFQYICGITPDNIDGLWLNSISENLFTYEFSATGHPICRYQWKHGERKDTIIGTPRIHKTDCECIWFTENYLEAKKLRTLIDDPVFVRPNNDALQWNDYRSLVKGKKVICLVGDEAGCWEDSIFPLLKQIRSSASQIATVYIPPLFGGDSLLKHLNIESIKTIQDTANNLVGSPTLFMDEDTYNEFASQRKHNQIYFPQDLNNNLFWYGLSDGNLVHSHPINIHTKEKLKNKFSINTHVYPSPDIRLSKNEVLNILSSIKQLTPFNTFSQIKDLINRHVYFEYDQLSTLCALWVLGTYSYQLFQEFPYLHLIGIKGSGKTTLIEIICECSFNGILESQTSKANLIKKIHEIGGTVCLDEFEKNSIGTEDQYIQMLKSGYRRGGNYSRMAGKKQESTLNVYSPKALAGESEIGNNALKSRVLQIKTTEKPIGVSLNLWDMQSAEIKKTTEVIRRGGYALGLNHFRSIKRNYNRIPPDIQLPSGKIIGSRKRQLVAPLLSIARLLDTGQDSTSVEGELLTAVEISWNEQFAIHNKAEKLLYELLEKWNKDSSFKGYKVSSSFLWIHNDEWYDTELEQYLGSKDAVLKWFNNLNGVKKGSTYFSYGGGGGCTVFPLNLKIKNTAIGEIFSRKSPQKPTRG
ncbi:hypothetical protein [Gracilimonas sediminicola]|uniref:hypothetical protein n=1 Tax=Gracilimonas sediminicola TaxID=2952158 RepID=UPI0038D4088D